MKNFGLRASKLESSFLEPDPGCGMYPISMNSVHLIYV